MRAFILVGAILALSACGTTGKPLPFERPPPGATSAQSHRPLILIPGALGSRLRDDEREIWPGPLTNFVFNRLSSLAVPIDPQSLQARDAHVEAYALFEGFTAKARYKDFRGMLASTGGYIRGAPGERHPPERRQYYVFTYDWRLDLAETADRFDQFIEQIRRDYNDPELRVDIVAYSMGALVARYFLRYGGEDVLDKDAAPHASQGAAKVRKVILVGAPNLGSITTLQALRAGRRFGLATLHPEVLATMPSVYQMLPHPDLNWIVKPDGTPVNVDLYSLQTWREFRWSIFDPEVRRRIERRFASATEGQHHLELLEQFFAKSLRRASRFHRALSTPLAESAFEYTVLGSDCMLTPARSLLERVAGRVELRLHPGQVIHRAPGIDYRQLLLEPGDGVVTRSSLLATQAQPRGLPSERKSRASRAGSAPVCAQHGQLAANAHVHRHLASLLGPEAAPSVAPEFPSRREAQSAGAVARGGLGS